MRTSLVFYHLGKVFRKYWETSYKTEAIGDRCWPLGVASMRSHSSGLLFVSLRRASSEILTSSFEAFDHEILVEGHQ